MFHFIGFIISGFIIGLIARAIKPGDDSMSIFKTTLMGMLGAVLAGWLGQIIGLYGPDEGAGFIASTLGAIAMIWIYFSVTHRNRIIRH